MQTLEGNDLVIDSLRGALLDAEAISLVPGLLKRILREECWRHRRVISLEKEVHFERFADFMSTPPLEGLGFKLDFVRNLVRDDPEALDLLDRALVQGPGNPTGANQHGPGKAGMRDNVTDSSSVL
jgi:hypothetical protein